MVGRAIPGGRCFDDGFATGASIVLWGAALWQRDGVARLAAAAGVIVGAVLALGIVSGSLHLNVRGIVFVTILQGI